MGISINNPITVHFLGNSRRPTKGRGPNRPAPKLTGDTVSINHSAAPTDAAPGRKKYSKRALRKMALAEDVFQGPSRERLLITLDNSVKSKNIDHMRQEGWLDIVLDASRDGVNPFERIKSMSLTTMPLELLLFLEQRLDTVIEGSLANTIDEDSNAGEDSTDSSSDSEEDSLDPLSLLNQLESRMNLALSTADPDREPIDLLDQLTERAGINTSHDSTSPLLLLQQLEERFDLPIQAIAHVHDRAEESIDASLEGKGLIEQCGIQSDKVDDLIQQRTAVRTALYRMAASREQVGHLNDLIPKAERQQGKLDSPDKLFDSKYRGALIGKKGIPESAEKAQEIELTQQITDEKRKLGKLEAELRDRIKSRMEVRTVLFNRSKNLLIETLRVHSPQELEALEDTYGDLVELQASAKPDPKAKKRMERVRRERKESVFSLPTSDLSLERISELSEIVKSHIEELRKPPRERSIQINSELLLDDFENPAIDALADLLGLTQVFKHG